MNGKTEGRSFEHWQPGIQPGVLKKLKNEKSSSQPKYAEDSPVIEDSPQRALDFISGHWQKLYKTVGSCDSYAKYGRIAD